MQENEKITRTEMYQNLVNRLLAPGAEDLDKTLQEFLLENFSSLDTNTVAIFVTACLALREIKKSSGEKGKNLSIRLPTATEIQTKNDVVDSLFRVIFARLLSGS